MSDINNIYDEQASEYDSVIRKMVPGYEFFMTITPVLLGRPGKVLDIGSGTGGTALSVKKVHPQAEVTCIEPSEGMRNILQTNIDAKIYHSRIEDFIPEEKYDAVTATLVMQNVQTVEEKKEVYKKIYDSMNDNGVFVTCDIIEGENNATQALYMTMWRQFMLNTLTEDEVDGKWIPMHKEKDAPLKLTEQFTMLAGAGFRSIDIINKNLNFVMMAAYK